MRELRTERVHQLRQIGKTYPVLGYLVLSIVSLMACQPASTDIHPTLGTNAITSVPTRDSSIIPLPTQNKLAVSSTTGSLPTLTPTLTATTTPPAWETVARGITRAYLTAPTPDSEDLSYVYALRVDPAAVTVQIHYDQAEPHLIEEWQAITGASIVVNGGFFHSNNYPDGQIIVDGQLIGSPRIYDDQSIGVPGLFAVTNGKAELYTLGRVSYSPRGLRFDQAIEAYPMLLLPGGQPAIIRDTGHRARRTVIALDEQGQIVILLIDLPLFSLFELSNWLAASGAGYDSALNLDGGRSSGIAVSLPNEVKVIPALVPLPVVIAVYPGG